MKHLRDIGLAFFRFLDVVAQVLTQTVERRTPPHRHATGPHIRETVGIVRLSRYRLRNIASDLGGADVERGSDFDVTDVVISHAGIHQAGNGLIRADTAIMCEALYERGSAVANSDDTHTHAAGVESGLSHSRSS